MSRILVTCLAFLTIAILFGSSEAAQTPAGPKAARVPPHGTFRLENRLGVQTTFDLRSFDITDTFLSETLGGDSIRLPLRLADNVYVSVGAWALTGVTGDGTSLVLTLKDGTVYRGRGEGSLHTDAESSQAYSVNSIKSLTPVEITDDWKSYNASYSPPELTPPVIWKVTLTNGRAVSSFMVREPQFAIRYYSSAGYVLGGSNRTDTQTGDIAIKIGADRLTSPIGAFTLIEVSSPARAGDPARLRMRAPNGTESVGALALEVSDEAGPHRADGWMIHGSLDAASDARIALNGRLASAGEKS